MSPFILFKFYSSDLHKFHNNTFISSKKILFIDSSYIFVHTNFNINPAYGRHYLPQCVRIKALWPTTKQNIWVQLGKHHCFKAPRRDAPILNKSLLLRLYGLMRGRFMSGKLPTCGQSVTESNLEHLLVFKAPCGSMSQVDESVSQVG